MNLITVLPIIGAFLSIIVSIKNLFFKPESISIRIEGNNNTTTLTKNDNNLVPPSHPPCKRANQKLQ